MGVRRRWIRGRAVARRRESICIRVNTLELRHSCQIIIHLGSDCTVVQCLMPYSEIEIGWKLRVKVR